ncbi:MAG: twin-arginine translocation signal domain-containing protein [archaeon]
MRRRGFLKALGLTTLAAVIDPVKATQAITQERGIDARLLRIEEEVMLLTSMTPSGWWLTISRSGPKATNGT